MDLTPFRGLVLLLPILAVGAAFARKQPGLTQSAAALLATLWCLPSLLLAHLAVSYFGWWTYAPTEADILGMPLDILFAWALGWGALPVIAWPGARLTTIVLVAFGIDALYMPQLKPFVMLSPDWWWGEAFALLFVLAPAQCFARWTHKRSHLIARASMQCLTPPPVGAEHYEWF